jgi:hypothetical protein
LLADRRHAQTALQGTAAHCPVAQGEHSHSHSHSAEAGCANAFST